MNVQMPGIWNMGWIEVVCGSMFSGKTEELIRRLNRAVIAKQKVQVFKPKIDDRYAEDKVTSHSSQQFQAINVDRASDILERLDDNTRVVAIDEAQFLDDKVVDVCTRLANRGLRVIVAGLDLDYLGVPFGPMPTLMAIAEYVTKMSAICSQCGNTASRTQRLKTTDNANQILIGATNFYEARCRRCFDPQ